MLSTVLNALTSGYGATEADILSGRVDSGFSWPSLAVSQMDIVSFRRGRDSGSYVLGLLHVSRASSACPHHLAQLCQLRVAGFILAISISGDAFREADTL